MVYGCLRTEGIPGVEALATARFFAGAAALAVATLAAWELAAMGGNAEVRGASTGATAGTGGGFNAASGAGVGVGATAGGLGNGNIDETCDWSGVFCLAISFPAITPRKKTAPESTTSPIRITKIPPALISNRISPPSHPLRSAYSEQSQPSGDRRFEQPREKEPGDAQVGIRANYTIRRLVIIAMEFSSQL